MRKLFLAFLVLGATELFSQRTDDAGRYLNEDGSLFSGVLSSEKNSVRSEITVKNGLLNGAANYFYASGKLMESGMFKDGMKDDKWIRYGENGQIIASGLFLSGKKHGTWIVFDESGKKRFEMNYNNGEKTGIWTNWDENGTVVGVKDHSAL